MWERIIFEESKLSKVCEKLCWEFFKNYDMFLSKKCTHFMFTDYTIYAYMCTKTRRTHDEMKTFVRLMRLWIPLPLFFWNVFLSELALVTSLYTQTRPIQKRLIWPFHRKDTEIPEMFSFFGLMVLENHHLTTILIKSDSCQNHQRMLMLAGASFRNNRILT